MLNSDRTDNDYIMKRITFQTVAAGQKIRDTENERTYRVTFVCRETPTVKVATEHGTRELTQTEFLRMEHAQ